jgi:hypothetical protein
MIRCEQERLAVVNISCSPEVGGNRDICSLPALGGRPPSFRQWRQLQRQVMQQDISSNMLLGS